MRLFREEFNSNKSLLYNTISRYSILNNIETEVRYVYHKDNNELFAEIIFVRSGNNLEFLRNGRCFWLKKESKKIYADFFYINERPEGEQLKSHIDLFK